MTESPRWLDAQEHSLWRSWLETQNRIHLAIQRDLRDRSALTEPEFEVLVHLTEHRGHQLRMGALAALLQWDRSRLSHQVARMERRGLVRRTEYAADGRGALVEATDAGREAIAVAAPGHVETVRVQFIDRLDAAQRRQLADLLAALDAPVGIPALETPEETKERGAGGTPPAEPVRVAVVPDSFKGSITAAEAACALEAGVRSAAEGAGVVLEVVALPFADGGEGTLDAVLAAWDSRARSVQTTDALGRPTTARYGLSPDGRTGLVETAEANGLPAVSDVPLRPLEATTAGIGPLITALLDAQVEEIVLSLGGSATTDGGTGLLGALGARLLDGDGAELGPGGGDLRRLQRIDTSSLDPRLAGVRWRLACDVTNPLTGSDGAAAVFAPQKGAGPEDITVLDAGLVRLAEVIAQQTGRELADVPGMGAAGGLAGGLSGFLEVTLEPGWELVAEITGARERIGGAELVLTGEGRFDTQSLHGKVVHGVRQLAADDATVLVVAGSLGLDADRIADAGLAGAFSIAPGPADLDGLRREAAHLLQTTARSVTGAYLAGRARR